METLPNSEVFEVGRVRGRAWRCAGFDPGVDTEVEVRFEAVGEETRVRGAHRGCDVVPPANPARHGFPLPVFLQREAEWWRAMLKGVVGS